VTDPIRYPQTFRGKFFLRVGSMMPTQKDNFGEHHLQFISVPCPGWMLFGGDCADRPEPFRTAEDPAPEPSGR
jgi:hypothetical protein